jgi:hypothetical protein
MCLCRDRDLTSSREAPSWPAVPRDLPTDGGKNFSSGLDSCDSKSRRGERSGQDTTGGLWVASSSQLPSPRPHHRARLVSERHELLGGARVNAERSVENLLGGAGLDGHGNALHDFGGVLPDPVETSAQAQAKSRSTHTKDQDLKLELEFPLLSPSLPSLLPPTLRTRSSPASHMWHPITLPVSEWTIIFISVFSSRPVSVFFIGRNFET